MRRRGLPLLVAALFATVVVLELFVRRSEGIRHGRGHLLLIILGWLAAGALMTLLVIKARVRRVGLLVLAVTAVTQAIALASGPQLSNDLYRYTWDGQVAASGTDVYLYPPDAPQLAQLRTPYLWPDAAQCTTRRAARSRTARADPFDGSQQPGCTLINRRDDRTIYPPVAELSFRIANAITPNNWAELQVQAPAALSALLLLALIVLLLRKAGQSAAWALLYAATPLSGLETTMDGHVDVVAAICTLGVVLVLASSRIAARPRLQQALVGIGLAAAILVKLYPAVFAPSALGSWRGLSRRIVVTLWVLATALALYARHVIATDGKVIGYLPGYLSENGYNSGMRYALLDQLGLPTALTTGLVVVLVAVVLLVPAVRVAESIDWQSVARRMLTSIGVIMLLVTPGNAWYCVPLAALAAITRRPEWLGVAAANYVSYFDAILNWHSHWPLLAYALAAVLAIGISAGRLAIGSPSEVPSREPRLGYA